jgi:DNA polymerase-1
MWEGARLDQPKVFNQAVWRGRYAAAVAAIRATGVPVDVALLKRLNRHWKAIKLALVARLDTRYDVYVGASFNFRKFEAYLKRVGLLRFWPRLDSGRLASDEETFEEMAKLFPQLEELRQVHRLLSKFKLVDLEVGQDGRNRFWLAPFSTKTSRNAPSNSRFVFGPFKGLRNLIRAPEGHAIAYCDWTAQEFGVAAALSNDENMWATFATGDPHIEFAKLVGMAPKHATKKTHEAVRDVCKALNLGVLYGMSSHGLARRAKISVMEAEDLIRRHWSLYPDFWRWSRRTIDAATLGLPLTTRCGWKLQYPPFSGAIASPRTAQNFPVQATGAEMMRYAAIHAVEAGLSICCPVHDAFLIEAPIDRIEEDAKLLVRIMGDASEAILGSGRRIPSDEPKIKRWPESYLETKGLELFQTLVSELEEAEKRVQAAPEERGACPGMPLEQKHSVKAQVTKTAPTVYPPLKHAG